MPVLPALQSLFTTIARNESPRITHPVAELRRATQAALEKLIVGFYADAQPLEIEEDRTVPVDSGEIVVRIYAPRSDRLLPCHVYCHGGGFWLGSLDHFDALCRATARDAHCAVAAVDYRLAPEHKFPAAAEDTFAALAWLRDHAPDLNIDPSRMSVGGVSAGGNLAAVVSLMARDRGHPLPVLQVLEVPITDLSDWTPLRIPSEDIELASGKDRYCDYYLDDPGQAALPYVSPLLTPDLSGLPPALILCAEYDPLAAEGKAYADRLADAGIAVDYHLWPGQFHGAQAMAKLIPEKAAAYHATVVNALRRAYGEPAT